MALFWRQGYRATTMQDLVAATGVQRASLYRVFGNKAEIFATILGRYSAWRAGRLDLKQPPRDLIRQWLVASVEDAQKGERPRGCLLVLSASEALALAPAQQVLIQAHMDRLEHFFAGCVRQAAPEADAEGIAAALLAANIGLYMLSRAGAAPARLATIVDNAMRLVPLP